MLSCSQQGPMADEGPLSPQGGARRCGEDLTGNYAACGVCSCGLHPASLQQASHIVTTPRPQTDFSLLVDQAPED